MKQTNNTATDVYTVIINYDRPEPEDQVYLLFTAANAVNITGGLVQNVPITVAALKAINPKLTLTFDDTTGGRLYAGIGEFDIPVPLPHGTQYYGWIEFTRKAVDTCVWLNLSNVDVLGIPLTVSGTDVTGATYSLGYAEGVTSIQNELANNPKITANAIIKCTGPSGATYTKILGPNNIPTAYPTYQTYVSTLCNANAQLSIISDIPGGTYQQETFTGGFVIPSGPTGVIIDLVGNYKNRLQITQDQFTDTFIYGCGGGTLLWNGAKVPQNDGPSDGSDPSPSQILHDSVFRILCVGINEGYFLTNGINYSSNFAYYSPFTNSPGSIYANVIHCNSNSYGFPYSDSNLKVQALAGRNSTITFNIIGDDVAKDYSKEIAPNPLTNGKYQFGIGTNSSLGDITMGNVRYLPTDKNGYGGYLPTFDDWYKMNFFGGTTEQYIWLKTPGASGATGSVECGNAFTSPPTFNGDNVLQWGANTVWNPGAVSPAKPS